MIKGVAFTFVQQIMLVMLSKLDRYLMSSVTFVPSSKTSAFTTTS